MESKVSGPVTEVTLCLGVELDMLGLRVRSVNYMSLQDIGIARRYIIKTARDTGYEKPGNSIKFQKIIKSFLDSWLNARAGK